MLAEKWNRIPFEPNGWRWKRNEKICINIVWIFFFLCIHLTIYTVSVSLLTSFLNRAHLSPPLNALPWIAISPDSNECHSDWHIFDSVFNPCLCVPQYRRYGIGQQLYPRHPPGKIEQFVIRDASNPSRSTLPLLCIWIAPVKYVRIDLTLNALPISFPTHISQCVNCFGVNYQM